MENSFWNLMAGYTGRRAGALPGYDAKANGVLVLREIETMFNRYLIDEYPSRRHFGIGMGGRRPEAVYKMIMEQRGAVPPTDPDVRRMHLGWEERVTPTDEGVRVFSGLYYNSTELQTLRERVKGKVSVYVDPDDVSDATVLLPGAKEPLRVPLQTTVFIDMTLPEVVDTLLECAKEDPQAKTFYEDRLRKVWSDRYERLRGIESERCPMRSFRTVDEVRAGARAAFAAASIETSSTLAGTVRPGSLMSEDVSEGIITLGQSTAHPFSPKAGVARPAEKPDPVEPPLEEARSFMRPNAQDDW